MYKMYSAGGRNGPWGPRVYNVYLNTDHGLWILNVKPNKTTRSAENIRYPVILSMVEPFCGRSPGPADHVVSSPLSSIPCIIIFTSSSIMI